MGIDFHSWVNLLLRWIHLIAGISWIGSSFYFMWLDSHIAEPEKPKKDVEGELWMVHSGGFYQVEKRLIAPGEMPKTLHWFKWEATFTWLSGFVLLAVMYYMTGGVYLLDANVSQITAGQATLLGLGLLTVGWLVYDALWQSPIAKSGAAATTISCVLLFGVVYGLCHLLSGRAAYLHVGALFGTLMVLNVWVRILPAQQQMIDATKRGERPNYELGMHAKRRSVHNTYMTFPVLFIMLSNHYPMTYAQKFNWVVLLLLIFFGAAVRHAMVAKKKSGRWALAPAAVSLLVLLFMTATPQSGESAAAAPLSGEVPAGERVRFSSVRAMMTQRCLSCHAATPADNTFGPSPGGVTFEDPERIKALADRINFRAVVTKTMPLANKTGMTDEERELLSRWIKQGASLDE